MSKDARQTPPPTGKRMIPLNLRVSEDMLVEFEQLAASDPNRPDRATLMRAAWREWLDARRTKSSC